MESNKELTSSVKNGRIFIHMAFKRLNENFLAHYQVLLSRETIGPVTHMTICGLAWTTMISSGDLTSVHFFYALRAFYLTWREKKLSNRVINFPWGISCGKCWVLTVRLYVRGFKASTVQRIRIPLDFPALGKEFSKESHWEDVSRSVEISSGQD